MPTPAAVSAPDIDTHPSLAGRAVIFRAPNGLHYGRIVRAHAGFYEVRSLAQNLAVLPSEVVSTFLPH